MKITIIPVTSFQQNCSVLMCEETNKAAIVDPGGDLDQIVEAIEQMGAVPEKILLTHGHTDHCAGTAELAKRLQVPVEGPHPEDAFLIERLPQQAARYG